jgi:hypothetical protein
MAMQAAELYELVKDCPEVIPDGLVYATCMLQWHIDPPPSNNPIRMRATISAEHAADLILAGVVRKLWTLRYGCDLSYDAGRYDPTGRYDLTTYTDDQFTDFGADIHSGPTPLHAALAAYRKVKP